MDAAEWKFPGSKEFGQSEQWLVFSPGLGILSPQFSRNADERDAGVQFVESGSLNPDKLNGVLERHGLVAKWKEFEDKYLKE